MVEGLVDEPPESRAPELWGLHLPITQRESFPRKTRIVVNAAIYAPTVTHWQATNPMPEGVRPIDIVTAIDLIANALSNNERVERNRLHTTDNWR